MIQSDLMYDMNEVQPIDDYVRSLLKEAKKKYNLDINIENPTRGQRLKAALAMQHEDGGFYSMEIMVGRRVDTSDRLTETLGMLQIADAVSGNPNPERLYSGFAHQYWPGPEK